MAGKRKPSRVFAPRRNVLNQRRGLCAAFRNVGSIHVLGVFEFARDLEHGFAFAHGKWPLVDLAIGEFPEDFFAAERMVEEIFACYQRALRLAARVESQMPRHCESGLPFSACGPRLAAMCRAGISHEDAIGWDGSVRASPWNTTGSRRNSSGKHARSAAMHDQKSQAIRAPSPGLPRQIFPQDHHRGHRIDSIFRVGGPAGLFSCPDVFPDA